MVRPTGQINTATPGWNARRWKNAVLRPGAQHMMGSGGPCRIARPRPSADHAELSARWDGRSGTLDQVRSVPGTMKPEEKQPCSRHQHTTAGRCGSSRRETCAAEDSGSGVQHWTASPLILALPAISPTERAMMRSSDETNLNGPGSSCRGPLSGAGPPTHLTSACRAR